MDLKETLNAEKAEIDAKLKLFDKYPNLREQSLRWRKVLCSKDVNSIADQTHFYHSCGCCSDSPLYVGPYVQDGEFKIYTDPPQFMIGEKDPYGDFYEIEYDDWQEDLKKINVQNVIIEQVTNYFKESREESADD